MMDAATAGAYTGLCADSFRLLAARWGVKAVDMGLRAVRYRKADIDRMVDSLPLRDADNDDQAVVVDLDPQAIALAKVRARSRGR